jgi:hypothetical protein
VPPTTEVGVRKCRNFEKHSVDRLFTYFMFLRRILENNGYFPDRFFAILHEILTLMLKLFLLAIHCLKASHISVCHTVRSQNFRLLVSVKNSQYRERGSSEHSVDLNRIYVLAFLNILYEPKLNSKFTVLWDLTPHSPTESNPRFEENCRLHLHDRS